MPVPLVPAALLTVVAPLFQSAVASPATTLNPAGKVDVAVLEEVVPMDEKSWDRAVSRAVMFIWAVAAQGSSRAHSHAQHSFRQRVDVGFMVEGWLVEGWNRGEIAGAKHVLCWDGRNTGK